MVHPSINAAMKLQTRSFSSSVSYLSCTWTVAKCVQYMYKCIYICFFNCVWRAIRPVPDTDNRIQHEGNVVVTLKEVRICHRNTTEAIKYPINDPKGAIENIINWNEKHVKGWNEEKRLYAVDAHTTA